jgi:hypothetical protein
MLGRHYYVVYFLNFMWYLFIFILGTSVAGVLTGTYEPVTGFSKLLMTVKTLAETRCITYCITSGFPSVFSHSEFQRLTETCKRLYEAGFVRLIHSTDQLISKPQ